MQRLRTNAHGFAGLVTEHVDSTAQLEEAAQHTQRRVAELESELDRGVLFGLDVEEPKVQVRCRLDSRP